jgi:hypothetical protein
MNICEVYENNQGEGRAFVAGVNDNKFTVVL